MSVACGFHRPILNDLSNKLAHVPGSKDTKQILVDVRYYLNPESQEIDWTKIIHW